MGDWGQAGQGALGGAATGAAVGSFGGPVGTAIGAGAGAIIGGVSGWLSSDDKQKYQDELRALAQKYSQRQAPQTGPASQSAYSQFRANQQGLIAMVES